MSIYNIYICIHDMLIATQEVRCRALLSSMFTSLAAHLVVESWSMWKISDEGNFVPERYLLIAQMPVDL